MDYSTMMHLHRYIHTIIDIIKVALQKKPFSQARAACAIVAWAKVVDNLHNIIHYISARNRSGPGGVLGY